MTILPNNKDPSEDKSEQSRDIVEKAGEIGADEDRSSVYDLTELLAKARARKEARSPMLDQDDIDVLHQGASERRSRRCNRRGVHAAS
jgi:hypothetical protein